MKIINPRFTGIAFILIGIGLFPFFHGLNMIVSIDKSEQVTIGGTVFKLEKLTSINLSPDYGFEETAPVDNIKVNFDTMVIFEGDEVGITATATGVDPNVKGIALLISYPDKKLSELSNQNLAKEIEIGRKFRTVIELVPFSDPPFHTRQIVPFLIPNQDVIIYGAVLTENALNRIQSDEVITTVHPRTDKLQAETNKAILKQIEETKKQTMEQDTTNNIFLGLTWIGISAFPIWFGGEMFLRVYLKND